MTTARILTVSAFYPREADTVFAEAINIPGMIDATRGLATYEGLPDGAFEEGQSYQTYVTVWGWMHNPRYQIHVERLNPATREMQSREQGRAIRQWDHTLSVTPTAGGAIWQDRIIVDSGFLTGYMVRVGRHMYKYRHRMRDASRITATIDKP
ncbi:hypothetical protein [Gymnodinialimonas ceratoperidinii]|uniref:Uncharacterized protein n=1 Tax=Gymnodinialimonas ceratoperidinii TaxID=2856823 RepID=A0A8F6YDM5_9RHOB|nr:hypothetical protein [Gymnodinialimonas ceratoperidinii]QXT40342.1 hypothetical protein KYE46_03575 [Gymnodinialimonas ceratoperidinii]